MSKPANTPNVVFREDGTVLIKNAVLSYPHLYEPFKGNDGGKGKYSAKFLLPNETHTADAKALLAAGKALAKEALKTDIPAMNFFIKSGEMVGKTETEKTFFHVSASESARPKVIDRDKSPIAEEDAADKIYPGAVVNVLIRLWAQDNKWGKKINANLLAVQFVKKGERIAGREEVDTDDAFEDVSSAFGGDDDGDTPWDDDDGFGS